MLRSRPGRNCRRGADVATTTAHPSMGRQEARAARGASGTVLPFDGDPAHMGSYALVRATTLDRLVGGGPVDMVKSDVEGAEGRMLRGAGSLLAGRRP